ncbi:Ubiquitin carboxyl-terminal hydrolase [Carpediemonas membranifera]|uniref:Ubiquitin carboxyl-terminal hydrolase n=1 Tax=Carpediemonas membranifera TaxID=201153 RepID=A0A8J6EAQ5_9EUKA|nr:Ubiquitin carboxyl-terminal hydrolase [Carpediemonas membranifera]|eukprot:KAG9395095.1 Ubiquitin carboxyl-terminal hydrolase [Carpediemonas membranifera]
MYCSGYSYNNRVRNDGDDVGLVNQGATCYMNSLLQALYHTPEFRNIIYSYSYDAEKDGPEDESIPLQLQYLFAAMERTERSCITTDDLTKAFGWDSMDSFVQQDVHETSKILLDALENCFAGHDGLKERLVAMSYGKLHNSVRCLKCHNLTTREEPMSDLAVDLRPDLTQALEALLESERLEGDNRYYCDKCAAKVDADKFMSVGRLPPVMHVHVKRFGYDPRTWSRMKHDNVFAFPLLIDMAPYVSEEACTDPALPLVDPLTVPMPTSADLEASRIPPAYHSYFSADGMAPSRHLYSLFGLLIHAGSAMGGHYYAYVAPDPTDPTRWCQCDDDCVEEASIGAVFRSFGVDTPSAYMLLYRRVGPVEPALIPAQALAAVEKDNADFREEARRLTEQRNTVTCFVNTDVEGNPISLLDHAPHALPMSARFIVDRTAPIESLSETVLGYFNLKSADYAAIRVRTATSGRMSKELACTSIEEALGSMRGADLSHAGKVIVVEVFRTGADVYPAGPTHAVVRTAFTGPDLTRTPAVGTIIDRNQTPAEVAKQLAATLGLDPAQRYTAKLQSGLRRVMRYQALDNFPNLVRYPQFDDRALFELELAGSDDIDKRTQRLNQIFVLGTAVVDGELVVDDSLSIEVQLNATAAIVQATLSKRYGIDHRTHRLYAVTADEAGLSVGRELGPRDMLTEHIVPGPAGRLADTVLPGFVPEHGETIRVVLVRVCEGLSIPAKLNETRVRLSVFGPGPVYFADSAFVAETIIDKTAPLADVSADLATLANVTGPVRLWRRVGDRPEPLVRPRQVALDTEIIIQQLTVPDEKPVEFVFYASPFDPNRGFEETLQNATEVCVSDSYLNLGAMVKLASGATHPDCALPDLPHPTNVVPRIGVLGPKGVVWAFSRVPGTMADVWARYAELRYKQFAMTDTAALSRKEMAHGVVVVDMVPAGTQTGYISSTPPSPGVRQPRSMLTASRFLNRHESMPKIGRKD